MRISVIGLGYIGLPTALALAANGHKVVGTDKDEAVVKQLQSGKLESKEHGVLELYHAAVEAGIQFTNQFCTAELYIIAVPTPYIKSSKKIDVSYVVQAVQAVQNVCSDESILVIESTVSPGTIDRYIRPLLKKNVHLVHAPERIIPGNMIKELKNNSRIIGADTLDIGETVKKVYQSFCQGEIVITDVKTAEMTKVIENTYRDINIAFANELAKICRTANLDVYRVIEIANMHPRVDILKPGPGVGGHCISVDPWFLVGDYPDLTNMILTARKVNDAMPEYVLSRVSEIMSEHHIQNSERVGFYGLTYKEDVDDIRESPTLQLLECMRKHLAYGAKVYDPYVKSPIAPNQVFSLEKFLQSVDLVVVMVGHREIIEHQNLLNGKILLDTKNVIEKQGTYRL